MTSPRSGLDRVASPNNQVSANAKTVVLCPSTTVARYRPLSWVTNVEVKGSREAFSGAPKVSIKAIVVELVGVGENAKKYARKCR